MSNLSFCSDSSIIDSAVDSRHCSICLNKFTFSRRKHQCRVCKHLVCREDSAKKPLNIGSPPQRVCANCQETMLAGEVENVLQSDILRLQSEIQRLQRLNEDLTYSHTKKSQMASELEQKLRNADREFFNEQLALNTQLEEAEAKAEEIRKEMRLVQGDYDLSCNACNELMPQYRSTQEELEGVRKENTYLQQAAGSLKGRLDRINKRVHRSLSLSNIDHHLCEDCSLKVKAAYSARVVHPSVIDEGSLLTKESLLDRVSILQDLKAIDQRLQQSENKSVCLIF